MKAMLLLLMVSVFSCGEDIHVTNLNNEHAGQLEVEQKTSEKYFDSFESLDEPIFVYINNKNIKAHMLCETTNSAIVCNNVMGTMSVVSFSSCGISVRPMPENWYFSYCL